MNSTTLKHIETKTDYQRYCLEVADFFKAEGITNLSKMVAHEEPFFSSTPCECCSRPLGGDRITATGYNPSAKEIQRYEICIDCEYYAEYGTLDDMTMMDLRH